MKPTRGAPPRLIPGLVEVTAMPLHPLLGRLARERSGVTAVVIGISATVLMGAAGLAIDLGLLYTDRRAAHRTPRISPLPSAQHPI